MKSPHYGLEETRGAGARRGSTYRVELSDVELDAAISAIERCGILLGPESPERSQAVRALAKMRKARGS
jgi:hypothetical protein